MRRGGKDAVGEEEVVSVDVSMVGFRVSDDEGPKEVSQTSSKTRFISSPRTLVFNPPPPPFPPAPPPPTATAPEAVVSAPSPKSGASTVSFPSLLTILSLPRSRCRIRPWTSRRVIRKRILGSKKSAEVEVEVERGMEVVGKRVERR